MKRVVTIAVRAGLQTYLAHCEHVPANEDTGADEDLIFDGLYSTDGEKHLLVDIARPFNRDAMKLWRDQLRPLALRAAQAAKVFPVRAGTVFL